MAGHTVHQRGPALLLPLDDLPVGHDVVGARHGHVAEDVGVAPDELVVDAAQHVGDASLSFVYLDARHAEADVAEDLAMWEPKVQPGGIIAGHDYFDGVVPEGDFGVKSAVDGYFGPLGWTIHETVADRPWSSWWVAKPAE